MENGASHPAGEEMPEAGVPVPVKPRHHWLRRALLGLSLVVVAGVAVVVVAYLLRTPPAPQTVDSALDEFRKTSTSSPGADGFIRPAEGVYEARGSGREEISAPPNAQEDGATMPVTVSSLDDGCWGWRIDYNVAHWHEFDFCPDGADLLLTAQRNFQAWNFGVSGVENFGDYTCEPPAPIVAADAEAGDVFNHHCTGTNTAVPGLGVSDGPSEIVGFETLTIGGEKVSAIRQKRRTTLSGAQRGQVDEEWWYEEKTGLPLKSIRRYRLETDSLIGAIAYSEDGSWELASVEPRT